MSQLCPNCGHIYDEANHEALAEMIARLRHIAESKSIDLYLNDYVPVKQAWKLVGRADKTVRNWAYERMDRIPVDQFGGRLYFSLENIARYILRKKLQQITRGHLSR